MTSTKVAPAFTRGDHPHHPTTNPTGENHPMDHQALAEHIAGNVGLNTVTLKTRVDCERELGDFIPLDPAALLATYRQLVEIAATADDTDLDVYVQPLLTVIRPDGEEAFLPEDLAAAADYHNALLTCAATVYALQEEVKDTMARFIALTRAVERLEAFAQTTPLRPVDGHQVDLAGFGDARIHFEADADRYLLLSEVAEQLGVPIWTACKWADQEHLWAIQDQRTQDEERGDGKLGYGCLRNFVDLGFSFIADNPDAAPDAGGRRWSSYSDWLISHDRLPAFIMVSPWGQEFMNNTADHFAIGMRKVWGDQLNELTAYHADGTPAPGVKLFHTDLTEEEALRKARRGPAGGLEDLR